MKINNAISSTTASEQHRTLFEFPIEIRFGRHLRTLRSQRGVTQQQLAEASGLDRSFLQKVEEGQTVITLSPMYSAANALGMTLTEMLQGL